MSSEFFYRERKGVFVVASLAIWFVLLGVFGPYLPANASVNAKQMEFTVHGTKVLGHWVKENGLWKFDRISKIIKINRSGSRTASIARVKRGTHVGQTGAIASAFVAPTSVDAPSTTASVLPSRPAKVNKRVLRAQLADEIGRWAKIGNRWEWST